MELLSKTKNGGVLSSFWSDIFDNDRFFDIRRPLTEPVFSVPPANVIETGKSFTIELAVPGFSKDHLQVYVDGNVLSISAEKEEEENETATHYTRKEFRQASFARSFTLPQHCDSSAIEASYSDGMLTLIIPKKEPGNGSSKKKINVS